MEKMRVLCNPENPCTTRNRTQWGGGLLSSNVSKLGSKEVSKTCHLERSERSQTHPNLPLKREGTCNFTLAPWGEGVRRTGEGSRVEGKSAFTLAEVLITLGIIGVVAVMTMPAIIANIQDHVKAKRIENIRQKLSKVTDAMSATSGINGYADTMEFVAEMNKHMKIAKICDNEHLSACWPTKEVMLNDEGKMWEIAKTKNAKTLKIPKAVLNNYANTVGIVTADGTSMILSYDKTCDFNPEVTGYAYSGGLSNSASCLAGVFDWNGGKNPNKLGKDVITLGVASGLGNECAFELNGKCFTAPFTPTPITRAECEELKGELGIKECVYDGDYWAGAVKQCGGLSKMPTNADLTELAKVLYNTSSINSSGTTSGLTLDASKASSMGFTGPYFYVWSGEEYDSYSVYVHGFGPWSTRWLDLRKFNSDTQAVCSAD